ncbi:MAG TPA: PEP-CTERM sorting domain-containing protein [Gemmataceae bacterium]|nr:PEP-CTERM sorting domain-containing protein [Gemmataceae bacterium]
MNAAVPRATARNVFGAAVKYCPTVVLAAWLVSLSAFQQKAHAGAVSGPPGPKPQVTEIDLNFATITIPNNPDPHNNQSLILNGGGPMTVHTTTGLAATTSLVPTETVDISSWLQNAETPPGQDPNDVTIRADLLTITDPTGSAVFSFGASTTPDLFQDTTATRPTGTITGILLLQSVSSSMDLRFASGYRFTITYSGLKVTGTKDGFVDPSDPGNSTLIPAPDGTLTDPTGAQLVAQQLPVPEPSSLTLALAAVGTLAGCGWYWKRRQRLAL